jgi:hypothetical protein
VAHRITAGGIFNFDDLGAELGEHQRGERAGQEAGEIEDTNALERRRHQER